MSKGQPIRPKIGACADDGGDVVRACPVAGRAESSGGEKANAVGVALPVP